MQPHSQAQPTATAAVTGNAAPPRAPQRRRSIQTRVTLFTSAIFLIGIWALTLFSGHMLRSDIEQLLSEQQYSLATELAADIDSGIRRRLGDLDALAPGMATDLVENHAAVQSRLDNLPIFQRQFNGGVFAIAADGQVIAEAPSKAGHAGYTGHSSTNDHDRALAAALSGTAAIGAPSIDVASGAVRFNITVPIRDVQGAVVGALAGTTDLSQPSFLDRISKGHFGATGGYMLVSPHDRRIITASDKRRIMEASPPPGQHPAIDHFLAGAEGTLLLTNPQGVEVLQSVKQIPAAGWYVAVTMPSAEAFAPIRNLQRRMMAAALLLSLITTGLVWWMLRRKLSPILTTLAALPDLTAPDGRLRRQPLPVVNNDEIGQLVSGFNHLLQTLGERESALHESTTLLNEAQRLSRLGSWIHDITHDTLLWNDEMYSLLEIPTGSKAPHFDDFLAAIHPDDLALTQQNFIDAFTKRIPYELTHRLLMRDGRIKWLRVRSVTDYTGDGQPLRTVGIAQDITTQKATDDALHQAKLQLDSIISNIPAMVFLKRADDLRFEFINRAGEELLGRSAEEIVGKSDADFFSPDQAAFFEAIDRRALASGEVLEIPEETLRTASGETRHLHTRKTALCNAEGVATHLLGISVDITERKRSAERINQLAFYDQLTGLPNRTLLIDRLRINLAACARNHHRGALLFIDLDKFKVLNDTLGHDKGDQLLQQVAMRLKISLRGCDTVARLGGDEFVILLADLSGDLSEARLQTELIGAKLLSELDLPYLLDQFTHHGTASIGATLFDASDADIDALLKQADLAMYKAKAAGRNTLRFFDPHMETDVIARATLENDLRTAIKENQFLLHFQAQVSGGILSGSEALVRWLHPQRGLIPPIEFIPLAEETGMILPLGEWILEAACMQLAQWAQHPELAHLTVAVNVSAHQFHKEDFVDLVSAILDKTGANPYRLKLELTESLLIEDIEAVIKKMHTLKKLGVAFSLDDFGTGYSSLYYLKRLPLDQMKIDRSFICDILDNPNDAAIARTIVALAQGLGLSVIAEGVETVEQLDFLAELHCHAYQGFYFGRPLPLERFEDYAING